ncbi:MAG: UbiA prenyltransferase family protein [Pseudomonadota bacterium]|nr:UbiA prenyltransferase family protein [Pseudomonadota bacterium]
MFKKNIITLLRPEQYVKNLFIFAPLFFSFKFNFINISNSLLAFFLFSLVASSAYIFNDLMDINDDRNHPVKKFRPLADGKVSLTTAKTLIFLLSGIALAISWIVNTNLFFILFVYLVLNILYSLKLKHITILDISIIATGFVLRIFAGSFSINEDLSMWIITMTFLLALFLGLAKRRDDVLLSEEGTKTRRNIDGYNLEFINAAMVLMSGIIAVAYILFTTSTETINKFNTEYLYVTSFFVILGILRYMQITFVEKNSGDPTYILYKDKFLKITIILWLISFYLMVKII